jgi:hypothetical protein
MIAIWLFKDILSTERRQKEWNMIQTRSEWRLGKALERSIVVIILPGRNKDSDDNQRWDGDGTECHAYAYRTRFHQVNPICK